MIASGQDLTRLNENCVLTAQPDRKGKWEIGWGHDTPPSPGLTWTQEEADATFTADYATAQMQAELDLGSNDYWALNEPRRAVITDMAYELGGAGLVKFLNFLADVRAGSWQLAAMALRQSLLFSQVPERENRNIQILLSGEWSSD
jgi:lysozyme